MVSSKVPNTSSPTKLAPGATPSMRILQAAGSGWAPKLFTSVGVKTLSGDGVGVQKRLIATGGLARAVAREILIVNERAGVVGPDKVDVVGVDTIGDPGDLDPRSGETKRSGGFGAGRVGVGLGQCQALGGQLNRATAPQAPGMTLGVSEWRAVVFGVALADGTAGADGWARRIVTSGMTFSTAGLALSRAASPLDTVADTEFTNVKLLTWEAWTCPNSRRRGACDAVITLDRVAAAWLRAGTAWGWLLIITITC